MIRWREIGACPTSSRQLSLQCQFRVRGIHGVDINGSVAHSLSPDYGYPRKRFPMGTAGERYRRQHVTNAHTPPKICDALGSSSVSLAIYKTPRDSEAAETSRKTERAAAETKTKRRQVESRRRRRLRRGCKQERKLLSLFTHLPMPATPADKRTRQRKLDRRANFAAGFVLLIAVTSCTYFMLLLFFFFSHWLKPKLHGAILLAIPQLQRRPCAKRKEEEKKRGASRCARRHNHATAKCELADRITPSGSGLSLIPGNAHSNEVRTVRSLPTASSKFTTRRSGLRSGHLP